MRIILTVIALLMFAAPAQADEELATVEETCELVSESAALAMKVRQAGLPLSLALSDYATTPLLKLLIMQAYKESHYSTESIKTRKVNEFSSTWMMACYQQEMRLPN